MKKLNILIIIELFYSIFSADINDWRDYPACKLGRLQSPIEINENESIYANNFSFVYQNYKEIEMPNKTDNYNYSTVFEIEKSDGFINFERGGVIKQYEFKRFEIYPGIHPIDGKPGNYELHLIHEKNLNFNTNKNQYRSIQDANMYLVIVLRYINETNCEGKNCISDNGLLKQLASSRNKVNLNNYPVFQDKRAYFYEGASLHIPCDENVNYYIIKDFFTLPNDVDDILPVYGSDQIPKSEKYGRPVYKNFMNYREVMKSNIISIKIFPLLLLLFILF
jgi:carbonic anhydrase